MFPERPGALLEFLTSEEGQRLYAEANYEFPIKPGVPVKGLLASWGLRARFRRRAS